MKPVILSDTTFHRIMRAVQRVEQMPVQGVLDPYAQGTGSFRPFVAYLGKLTASCTKGSTGTLKVYEGTPGSESVHATSFTVDVFNKFADLESGKWVIALGVGVQTLYAIAAECST